MPMLLDPNWQRGYLVPYGRDKRTGQGGFAVPGVVQDMLSAMMLPGDVYQGNVLLNDPQTGRTSDQVIQRSADLAGLLTLGSGAIPADKNSLRMGIKAYHGSPHDFDRFDMSKIGTGEGAQAYGHGLYFAENEKVAKAYRDMVPYDLAQKDPVAKVAWLVDNAGGEDYARLSLRQYPDGPEKLELLKILDSGDYKKFQGRMYEVNIDANPDDFLDWDKPLSEQSAFQKIKSGLPYEQVPHGSKIGRAAVENMTAEIGDPTKVSAKLKAAGIPGIKYLDAGSRGAGDGSRNYVVFDDKLISIVKKYGVAALVSAGVLSQAQGEEMKAQGYY